MHKVPHVEPLRRWNSQEKTAWAEPAEASEDAPSAMPSNGYVPRATLSPTIRDLCQRILFGFQGLQNGDVEQPRVLSFTSCLPGEGVSTVAWWTAATRAAAGQGHVLLVDCNHSRPSLHNVFRVPSHPGLREVLAGSHCWSQAIHRQTGYDHLQLLTSGQSKPAFHWTADRLERFSELVEQLEKEYALVVLDMPPASTGFESLSLLARGGPVAVVMQAERVPAELARQTIDTLRKGHVHLLGVVSNRRKKYLADRISHRPLADD